MSNEEYPRIFVWNQNDNSHYLYFRCEEDLNGHIGVRPNGQEERRANTDEHPADYVTIVGYEALPVYTELTGIITEQELLNGVNTGD